MSHARGLRSRVGGAAALVGLLAASVALFAGVWQAGLFDVVPFPARSATGAAHDAEWEKMIVGDATFHAGIAARNAYALVHSPARLFDAEHCAPARSTLAFGEPLITMGVVAVPGMLATRDAIAAHNLALVVLVFASAVAMYVLIADWTGSRAAAAVAAVLYAFTGERITGISHAFLYDTSWLVFGLFFAGRLLDRGRWRDAAGLAVCGVLQLGTSVYPVLASLLVSLPIGVALVVRSGRNVPVSRLVAVAATLAAGAYAIFSPFLSVRAAHADVLSRSEQYFAAWSWFAPWREAGVAWSASLLALVALAASTRAAALRGSARRPHDDPEWGPAHRRAPSAALCWAVAAGAVLAAWASVGPDPGPWPVALPNLYAGLARVLPGLDAVRVPARADTGYHLGVSILAGFGAAALLARVPRHTTVVAGAMIAAVTVEAAAMVYGPGPPFAMEHVAPAREAGRFIDTTLDGDDEGALLELPIGTPAHEFLFQSPPRILAAAYHHRRTSACYGSFHPPDRERLRTDASLLPDAGALARICAAGFGTAVVHHNGPLAEVIVERLHEASLQPASGVRSLGTNGAVTLFDMCANEAGAGRLGGTHG